MMITRRTLITGLLSAAGAIVASSLGVVAQPQTVRGGRWLRVNALVGYAELRPVGLQWRRAMPGNFLDRAGDALQTTERSYASMSMDSNIALLSAGPNTKLVVRSLYITARGGRVTQLDVERGQLRADVRPFSNRDSRLMLHTPAGVSGVKGTDFGVSVSADGATAIATLEGQVSATAQGKTVVVGAGSLSTISVGESPTDPVPFNDSTSLIDLATRVQGGVVQVRGRTAVGNLIRIGDDSVLVDSEGAFSITTLARPRWADSYTITVTTPLGTEETYTRAMP